MGSPVTLASLMFGQCRSVIALLIYLPAQMARNFKKVLFNVPVYGPLRRKPGKVMFGGRLHLDTGYLAASLSAVSLAKRRARSLAMLSVLSCRALSCSLIACLAFF